MNTREYVLPLRHSFYYQQLLSLINDKMCVFLLQLKFVKNDKSYGKGNANKYTVKRTP